MLLPEYPDIENTLNESSEGVIIFGGSQAGFYTLKMLKKLKVPFLCIIIFLQFNYFILGCISPSRLTTEDKLTLFFLDYKCPL